MAWKHMAAALVWLAAGAQAAEEDPLRQAFEAQEERRARGLTITSGTALAPTTAGGVEIEAEAARPARDDARGALDLLPEAARSYVVNLPKEAEVAIRIGFALDSAAIAPTEAAKLKAVCAVMQSSDYALLRIFGHTDARGAAAYNLALSKRRAEAVRSAMIGGCGIAAARIEAHGLGEAFPVAGLAPRAGENRRVEFQIGR